MNSKCRWQFGVLVLFTMLASVACTSNGTAAPASSSDVVAKVGDRSITFEELDAKAMAANAQPYQQLYDARKAALNAIIEEHLLETEAEARGITPEELVRTEVTSKMPTVGDAEVAAFYEANKGRMGGRSLEEMRDPVRQHLLGQTGGQARANFIDTLKKKSAVSVNLDPPRVEVKIAANDPAKGPANAPVQIVEFSDFQ